jgi:phospholipid/cholesterol/gamma-HCH transport system substrate-binding protein
VVGAFVMGILGLLAAAILSLSQERGFWIARYRLLTYFDNVQGLIEGAPVRLAGKDIGTVESVSFDPASTGGPPVRVVLFVDKGVQHRIRQDSVAAIGTIGLLGDKYVEISMGTREAPALPDGGRLESRSPLDLNDVVVRGTRAIDEIAKLAESINGVVAEFDRSMGGKRLADTAAALSDVAREVQEGDGLLHSLVYDRYAGSGVESIEESLATLEEILDTIAHGDGILHTLIYESPLEQDLVMEALNAGANLNSILKKVDAGDGTLGLMVNDPTLYDDLKILVGGAQRSLLVRSMIRLASEGE